MPRWLHPLMMEWADSVLHLAWIATRKPDQAQHLTRQVFLAARRRAGEEMPRPADLLERAAHLGRRWGEEAPAPWESALRRLPRAERRCCWLALYGPWSFGDLAASEQVPAPYLTQSLEHLARAMAVPEPDPAEGGDSEFRWGHWLKEHGPDPLPPSMSFRWREWDPTGRVDHSIRIRPRQGLAVALVVLSLGGFAWHVSAAAAARRAAIPILPFTPQPSTAALHLVVAHGVAVAAHNFGSPVSAAVPARRLSAAYNRYAIATASPGHPSRAYQVGALQVAWARTRAGVGLIVADPSNGPVAVVNLASGGRPVQGTAEPGYRVYGFAGLAGAVRVVEAGHTTVLAWADGLYAGVQSGAWTLAAGQPAPRGPDGSHVYAAPPGSGTALGVIADGVLWKGRGTQWWLLPTRGPTLPLIAEGTSRAAQEIASLTAPYPAASNQVLAYENWLANGRGPDEVWWNLASERLGAMPGNVFPEQPVAQGWVNDGQSGSLMTYSSPPATLALPRAPVTWAAWGHSVFAQAAEGPGAIYGTYNWARRTWKPATVQPHALWGAVAVPQWGPTYVQPGGWAGEDSGLPLPGPMTVALTPASGRPPSTFRVAAGHTLFVAARWLVVASVRHPNRVEVGWPNGAGQLEWHRIDAPSPVHAALDFLYWTSPRHTYVWVPPFQPY